MSSPAARERWRNKRTDIVTKFCADNNFRLEFLNQGYQLRIEDCFDVYPTNGRWHWLPTGERGEWDTEKDLRLTMLDFLAKYPQLPTVTIRDKNTGKADETATAIANHLLSKPAARVSFWQKFRNAIRRGKI